MWMFLNPLKRLHHFSWLYNILLDFQHVLELAIHRGLGKRRKWLGSPHTKTSVTSNPSWFHLHSLTLDWHSSPFRSAEISPFLLPSRIFSLPYDLLRRAASTTITVSCYNLQLIAKGQRTLEIAVSNHLRLLATATWRWLQCDHLTQATVEVWSY